MEIGSAVFLLWNGFDYGMPEFRIPLRPSQTECVQDFHAGETGITDHCMQAVQAERPPEALVFSSLVMEDVSGEHRIEALHEERKPRDDTPYILEGPDRIQQVEQ